MPSIDQRVSRLIPNHARSREEIGVWLSLKTDLKGLSNRNIWWWLSPIIWPAEEAQYQSLLGQLLQKGSRNFVLNAPWQIAFFRDPQRLTLWAGPFCNLSNPLSIKQLKSYGFSGAMVSPELGQEDFLSPAPAKPASPGDSSFRPLAFMPGQNPFGPLESRQAFSKSERGDGLGRSAGFQLLGLSQLGA